MCADKNTFWKLISEHRIEIPPIQRDYAQGRKNSKSKEIRKSFVKQIKKTLSDSEAKMHLNFVYGKVNGKINAQKVKENKEAVESMLNAVKTYSNNLDLPIQWEFNQNSDEHQAIELTTFAPLDGQQRLTTLYLLHWYLMPNEENNKDILKKFTYKIRPSSKDFCNALVEHKIDVKQLKGQSIKAHIKNSAWFFDYWKYDPTVRGMLRMLDEIHEVFVECDFDTAWNRLISEDAIHFDFLDLEDYKLTDKLYVKMNARGVPLTPFENFKAWLIEHIQNENKKNENFQINTLKDKDGKERTWVELLDTSWTDLFWANKDEDNMLIDEELMRYFRNMMQIFLVRQDGFNAELEENRKLAAKLAIKPKGETEYKYVPNTFFKDNNLLDQANINELFISINNIANQPGIVSTLTNLFLPEERFRHSEGGKKNKGTVFTNFITGSMSYTDKLVFYALHLYLSKTKEYDESLLKSWMRVVRNLVNNSTIDSVPLFKNAVLSLRTLSENCNNIYEFLKDNTSLKLNSIDNNQIKEEAKKAILVFDNKQWEESFIKYENHPYFKGQIGFLLSIAEANEENLTILSFESYADKMSAIFMDKLRNRESVLFERALLTEDVEEYNDYLFEVGSNYTFGTLFGEKTSWKKTIFTCKKRLKAIQNLLDKVELDNYKDDLKAVCNSYEEIDWKYELINYPKAILSCRQGLIRYNDENHILLLGSSATSHYHAELFSFCLDQEIKRSIGTKELSLRELTSKDYIKVRSANDKAYGRYTYSHGLLKFELHLHYDHKNLKEGKTFLPHPYELKFFLNKEEVMSESEYDTGLIEKLKTIGFEWKGNENTKQKGYWLSTASGDDLIEIIKKLDDVL